MDATTVRRKYDMELRKLRNSDKAVINFLTMLAVSMRIFASPLQLLPPFLPCPHKKASARAALNALDHNDGCTSPSAFSGSSPPNSLLCSFAHTDGLPVGS